MAQTFVIPFPQLQYVMLMKIFFLCGKASADVTFGFIDIQDFSDFGG